MKAIMDQTPKKLKQLKQVLNHSATMLIVLQDNPDPDALASAVALRKLVNTLKSIQCSMTSGGVVARAENRALAKYLGLNLRPSEQVDFNSFDLIAMVDTQPKTGNNCLPENMEPDIVIDHHPCRKNTRLCRFTDIRCHYGATSTIVTEYLYAAGIEPEIQIATALLYGIRSDTQDLGRDTTSADIDALMKLYPLANKRMLSQIQRGLVRREYYRFLSQAIDNARVFGQTVISNLGTVDNPDIIGEMADLLLRDEQIEWCMCYGICGGQIRLSIRTDAEMPPASKVIRQIVVRRGTGGGHESYAGGQIPIDCLSQKRLEHLATSLEKTFLRQVQPDFAHSSGRKLTAEH
jgi:nanoRNase/pAp phosphatase (c-di-AMP/oligoRNAs hydrolase)